MPSNLIDRPWQHPVQLQHNPASGIALQLMQKSAVPHFNSAYARSSGHARAVRFEKRQIWPTTRRN
jgi:hypothetical protein